MAQWYQNEEDKLSIGWMVNAEVVKILIKKKYPHICEKNQAVT